MDMSSYYGSLDLTVVSGYKKGDFPFEYEEGRYYCLKPQPQNLKIFETQK